MGVVLVHALRITLPTPSCAPCSAPMLCPNALPLMLARDVVPSFVLMAIQDDKVVTYVYELHGTDMRVTKTEFSKRPTAAA